MCFCSVLHHTVRKTKCLCPGVQGRTSLGDLLLDIPLEAGLVLSAKQGGHSMAVGKVPLYTRREPRKQAEMSNRNIGGKTCNRGDGN